MELHQLRYFLELAQELHFSRAARRLSITQPALSRQIAALEAKVGAALFLRDSRGVKLTEAGVFLVPRAREVLQSARRLLEEAQREFGEGQTVVHLGFLSVLMDDLIGPSVRECRSREERLRVQLYELSPREQVERLGRGSIDIAVLGNLRDADRSRFAVRALSQHPMAAVVPIDHPLSGQSCIHMAQLAKDPWVSLDDELFPGRRDFLCRACRAAGFEPNISSEKESLSLMLGAVGSGEGVAILPRHSAKLSHHGCVFLPIQAPAPMAELLLLTRIHEQRPEVKVLIEVLARRALEVMK